MNLYYIYGFKRFAIRFVKEKATQTSRPKTDFKKHNPTSHRQAKSIAKEEVDKVKNDLKLNSDEEFLKNVKEEFNAVKEDDKETCWNDVKYQIEKSLQKKLHEKHITKKIVDALREHANYNYNENELHVEANKIIREVSEEQTEFIKDKIILAMNNTDLQKEEETIKDKLVSIFSKEKFWKGAGAALGKNIYKKFTNNFIHILAGIITAIITGSSFMGLI